MGQILNVTIIIILTVMLSIVTLGLAYLFDIYLNPFIIISTTLFPLLDIELCFCMILSIPNFIISIIV
jgi:hypothetical protein